METEGENPSNDLLEARKEQKRVAFSIPQDPARDWGLARLVGGKVTRVRPLLCVVDQRRGGVTNLVSFFRMSFLNCFLIF